MATTYRNYVDIIPKSTTPFLVSTDGRAPLTHSGLLEFISDGPDVIQSPHPNHSIGGSGGDGIEHQHTSFLNKLGLTKKDRICIALPNGPEAATCFLSLATRITVAPINIDTAEKAVVSQLQDLPAAAVILQRDSGSSSDRFEAIAKNLGIHVWYLVPDTSTAGLFSLECLFDGVAERKDTVLTSGGDGKDDVLSLDETCMILYTSGTTLRPKRVPLTQRNLCSAALSISSTLELTTADIGLNVMPLYHLHGIMVNVLVSAVAGAAVVCTSGWFDAASFFGHARDTNATWYSAVPSMHLAIVLHAEKVFMRNGSYPDHSIQLARNCSAALAAPVAERLKRVLGCTVLTTYAMTECVPICSNPRRGIQKLDSVGPPAGPDVRLFVDEEKLSITPNVEGEVCVKGDCCTAGYERRHDDAEYLTHIDGWLRTGDKGYFDDDGYLHLTGRYKELINRGGEKLSPLVIEHIIITHPSIAACTVFACLHEQLGEAVAVAVVPQPGASVSLGDIRVFLVKSKQVSSKWLPECLVFVDELPKGPTGKPMRIGLPSLFGIPTVSHGQGTVGVTWRASKHDNSWSLKTIKDALSLMENDPNRDTAECTISPTQLSVRKTVIDVLCVGNVDDDAILMDAGFDSMTTVLLIDRLSADFDIELPSNTLDVNPTIIHLAREIDKRLKNQNRRPDLLLCSAGAPEPPQQSTTDATAQKLMSNKAQEDRASRKAARRKAFEGSGGNKSQAENASKKGSGLYFAKTGDIEGIQQLISKTGWDCNQVRDRHGLTALQWAAGGGELGMVKYLIEELHAKVDVPNKEGRTPLMWATRNGHLEIAQYLVTRGADIKAVTKKGVSCLHWATWGGSVCTVEWLLQQNLDIEALSNAGCNAAVWAAAAGRIEMCEYLKSKNADFHKVNFWGHGVVSKASWHGHTELLKWLFDTAGVTDQLFIVNHIGEIPVELAQQAGHQDTVDLMLQYMSKYPRIFAPIQGSPTVHQHKQVKINGELHHFNDDM